MDVCFLCLRVRFLLLPPRFPPGPVSVPFTLLFKGAGAALRMWWGPSLCFCGGAGTNDGVDAGAAGTNDAGVDAGAAGTLASCVRKKLPIGAGGFLDPVVITVA